MINLQQVALVCKPHEVSVAPVVREAYACLTTAGVTVLVDKHAAEHLDVAGTEIEH